MATRIGKLALLSCFFSEIVGSPASAADLRRAKTKKPRSEYRCSDHSTMDEVLNNHLRRIERTVPCADWTAAELQELLTQIAGHKSDDLQQIYREVSDRRSMKWDSIDEHRAEWSKINDIVDRHPHLRDPHREALCREAVMWWTHHLVEGKRTELRTQNVSVPLLPDSTRSVCEQGVSGDAMHACTFINEKNSCQWCHSTQADHDAGVPGTSVPDGLKKTTGPDDGNPKGWDRKRRCDQDQLPRCQLCEGIGGRAWSDQNEDIDLTPCEIVAHAEDVNMSTVAPPIYPKTFTSRRKDGKQGGYSDTLIGWKTDPFCFGFFPQNDSIKPLCYRSEDSTVKYYDITREASRIEYTIHNGGLFSPLPNTSAIVMQVKDQMWIQNHLWAVDQCICANPSGNHCENPPCHVYIHRYDTFETAQYLGREKIGVEWIQNHGTGKSGKMMELDHFILWSHHVWTDPVSRRLVRAWKPFNGLQVYDPEAWTDSIENPDALFESPPAKCKKGGAPIRIHCDDDGNHDEKQSEGMDILDRLYQAALAESGSSAAVVI
eukprot:TRINITY_DN17190_c0_g1_i2.p1 TRINITY_DN17190_c0_g1~~TRINITY_DN17190_c0_g1_i2.p1  ORF type:complete len:546 (-),score=68.72 TRINITY_DN17190_c0_g1_i2:199-1836(-)